MPLSIIPARAGSIGVNKKNTRKLSDRPLIRWTFDFVISHSSNEAVVITTDDPQIISTCLGGESEENFVRMQEASVSRVREGVYMHKRRSKDAESNSPTVDSVVDLLNSDLLVAFREDWIWLFQPTSPFRNATELKEIEKFVGEANFDSLISVKKFESPHPLKAIKIDQQNHIVENSNFKNLEIPRQELGSFFSPDGAYYVTKAKSILENHIFYGGRNFSYERSGLRTLNIDTEIDFDFAEFIISTSKITGEI